MIEEYATEEQGQSQEDFDLLDMDSEDNMSEQSDEDVNSSKVRKNKKIKK